MSYLINFEGVEGSGKSTILHHIKHHLEEKGNLVTVTREPGGIDIAEQIRAVILDEKNIKMDAKTEALLYAAARRQHLVEKIIPMQEQGHIILCDRFIDSSLAYQGFARGLGIEEVLKINQFAIGELMPTLTIYLDLDPKIGLERIAENTGREVNRLDLEDLSFHYKVYEGYEEVINMFPDRIVRVNANQQVEKVVLDIMSVLEEKVAL